MPKFTFKKPELLTWIIVTVFLLAVLYYSAPQNLPVLQYKFSMLTLAVIWFYWVGNTLVDTYVPDNQPQLEAILRTAIICFGVLAAALAI